jgi:nitrite reductase/ring-hydroxylating ferredoxin subunit
MTEKLCNIEDIREPGAKGFELSRNNREFLMFLVKKDGQVYGYENKCPHAGVNLEWMPDDFLDMDKALIQCSVHGALFLMETGDCVGGPCNGQGLTPVAIRVDEQGDIFLEA